MSNFMGVRTIGKHRQWIYTILISWLMKRQKGNGWWLEGEEEADKEVAVI